MGWDARGDAHDYPSLTNYSKPIGEEEQRSRVRRRHLDRRATTLQCLVLVEAFCGRGLTPHCGVVRGDGKLSG